VDQDDVEVIERRIEKLLKLAEGREGEPEAAAALQKAQSLADAWNIEIAGIQGSKPGKREDNLFPGGLYPYQRALYEAIAKLNHCLYWSRKGLQRGEKYKHRIVGSKVNVLLTRQMAEYLQSTVERITRQEFCNGDPKLFFIKDAHYFREGIIERIVEKIHAKRREEEAERQRRKAEEAARASHPAYSGGGNALITIDDVAQREEEANYDFQYGEGAWARKKAREAEYAAELARRQEEARQRQAELEKWRRENPVEAAELDRKEAEENAKWWAEEEKRRRRNAARRKGSYRSLGSSKPSKEDSDAYWAGRDRGKDIGLDRQVGGGAKGLLK
jgi:hypothetical protein